MLKSKKYVASIVVILCLVILIPIRVMAAPNLMQNSGFEQNQSGVPEFWSQDVWVSDENASLLSLENDDVHSGNTASSIENLQPNHAKWVQSVSVKENTYYKISGWVKVVQMESSATVGANLFVLGVMGEYPQLTTPSGIWEEILFYGQTGPEQQEVTIGAGIGTYGTLVTGKALFDDITMEEVDKPGQDVAVISMIVPENPQQAEEEQLINKPISMIPVLGISVLFSLLFALLYNKVLRRQWNEILKPDYKKWLLLALLFALIVRIWLALAIPGYTGDLYTFMSWSDRLTEQGLGNFYRDGVFADYPPGYMIVLYVLGAIKSVFDLEATSATTRLLYKLPAILADLAVGVIIYQAGLKRFGKGIALGLMLLYVFNPSTLINSAAWGQMDGFFVLFLLLAIINNTEGRMERSAVWFAISVLIKPQTLIFTPVLLLTFLYRREWKRVLYSAGYGLAAFGLLALPFFWGNGGLAGILNLYKTTLSSYPYATINAFNLFALSGGNWLPIEQKWLFLSYQTWGYIFIVAATALAVYYFMSKEGKKGLASYFIGLVLITVVFVLGPKMHERYMFPALILSLFSFIQSKDRRLLFIYFGLSLTHFVNVAYVFLAYVASTQSPPTDGIVMLCSIANLGLLAYMLYVGHDIYYRGGRKPLQPVTEYEQQGKQKKLLSKLVVNAGTKLGRNRGPKFLRRKDWIWIGAITILYTVLALYNLGSLKDPQTVWEPRAAGDSVYVDFGATKTLDQVNIFGGVGSGKYKIEFGDSQGQWSQEQEIDPTGKVFEWDIIPVDVSARYAKLTVESPGFMVHEVAFFEKGKSVPVEIKEINDDNTVESIQGTPANLFDEPAAVSYKRSYLNSTYFDEIYHARTAYEHLNGLEPYENTHPPLGKLLIALGIKLFGVNPFGWRIVGTLFGAGMLPIIYALSLRIFGKREYAITASLLFSLDFMHFTLTRIATIDVYGVFFIMLMFYFMHRYVSQNFYLLPLRKTLVPLFLSGLFFGIGVASKWIVLYGGVGLAIMLGMSLYERYRQSVAARNALAQGDPDQETERVYAYAARSFRRNTIITLASCIGFFIIIPLIIYSLSFVPSLRASQDGFTFKGLVDAQTHMFDYHSQLLATHPFASSWWEWPFMKRPVWFYSAGDQVDQGLVSSIVTMGNPLIWWTGIFAMILTIWFSIKRKDTHVYVIWIAFLSQYVPWVLVPRSTFLYHYFAMVPFMILSIVYMMKLLESKIGPIKYIRYVYVALAALLFIMFYPVLSGMVVTQGYVDDILRWFSTWVF